MRLYKRFQKQGIPEYLARYYWWAYLWEKSIWFFDHQAIINAILFGQYETLKRKTLAQVDTRPSARLLQLTCVYGKFTPALHHHAGNEIHLCDVAVGQLLLAKKKVKNLASNFHLALMNAESLAYADDSFDQVILFFLFHEMPPEARQNVYNEIARVVKTGGSVLITEYGARPYMHFLYRFLLIRWLFENMEPFLPGFWKESVATKLSEALQKRSKVLHGAAQVEHCFSGFYRIMRFNVL